MAYTNFCCKSGGSNLNAGTRTGSTTEPGTSADFTYASGNFVSATGVFTPASGNPSTDGVAIGDWVSIYADGATVTTLIARVTAVSSTTITTSTTLKSGTTTDGTGNRTLKVGGAWAGPSGAVGFPVSFLITDAQNSTSEPNRLLLKNDQTYSITAVMSLSTSAVDFIKGYNSTYDDTGIALIEGPTSGASFVLLNASATSGNTVLENLKFNNNGLTGSSAGVTASGASVFFKNIIITNMRGNGLTCSSTYLVWIGGRVSGCNQSNTASTGGITLTIPASLNDLVVHDNTGTNTHGIRTTGSTGISVTNCIIESNGTAGGLMLVNTSAHSIVNHCDFYSNVGPGISSTNRYALVKNSNFILNGTYGIDASPSVSGVTYAQNCGFGAGTKVNTSGATTGNVVQKNNVTYPSNVTPWTDPDNGDFTISLTEAKNAGSTEFLDTYSTTLSTLDIGAGQSSAAATNVLITRPRKVM